MLPRLFLPFLLIFFVVACQTIEKNPVPLNSQITQLSSLIAATQFLRDYCSRSDIPDDEQVTQAAMIAAKNKGWNIENYKKIDENGFLPINRIQLRSKDIYRDLNNDKTPQSEKCQEFNVSLSPFINIVKLSKKS